MNAMKTMNNNVSRKDNERERERERVQKKAQTEETRIFALASIPMPAIHTRTNHPVRCWQFQKNLIPPPSLK